MKHESALNYLLSGKVSDIEAFLLTRRNYFVGRFFLELHRPHWKAKVADERKRGIRADFLFDCQSGFSDERFWR
jgi:hypothetical protein